jgi:hypothetical protein
METVKSNWKMVLAVIAGVILFVFLAMTGERGHEFNTVNEVVTDVTSEYPASANEPR